MDRPGFLDDLVLGSLRWDLLCPFPVQEPADRSCGDRAIADLGRLLDPVDAEAIDRHGILPGNLVDELRRHGFLALAGPPPHGSGLSPYNIFRAIDAAATASPPLALLMAIANGLGAAAYRSALPAGPLRDQLDRWVSAGVVSGTADTEPAGAGNSGRTTVALAVEDGTAYRLFGDKVFIGNAPVADVLAVSATVRECGHDQVRLFFVETHSPEFESYAGHEFLGLRGTPNGAIRLNGVRVPREHMLPVTGEWRDQPGLAAMAALARMYVIAAPALAIARQCVAWSERFVARRHIDGRPLGEYRHVHDLVTASRAELFALESVVQWCLLGTQRADTRAEQSAAKNISSRLCWRVVDRTMSLFAAEGYESARSKVARGIDPVPLERAFRDARALRIAGGVDFQLDHWAGHALMARYGAADEASTGVADQGDLRGVGAAHLRFVARTARSLARICRDPAPGRPGRDRMGVLGAVINELLTIPLVVARTRHLADLGDHTATEWMTAYCDAGRGRLSAHLRRLGRPAAERSGPVHGGPSAAAYAAGDR